MEVGDNSTFIHTSYRTERCRDNSLKHLKENPGANLQMEAFFLIFTLSSTGLTEKYRELNLSLCARAQLQHVLNADVTPLSDWCQRMRWFIIPIRPIRGFIEEYGLVGRQRETLTVPQSHRINFGLITAPSPPAAVFTFSSDTMSKHLEWYETVLIIDKGRTVQLWELT